MATSNYNLPQWKNGDEFHAIGQLNPAFTTIDATMKSNASAADAAQSTANTALTAANAAKTSADSKAAYGKVKLVEDEKGNGVIVTLGVVNE